MKPPEKPAKPPQAALGPASPMPPQTSAPAPKAVRAEARRPAPAEPPRPKPLPRDDGPLPPGLVGGRG